MLNKTILRSGPYQNNKPAPILSYKFYSQERLKSRKEIGRLFGKGARSATAYPIRVAFGETEEVRGTFPFQAGFVVPKRRFKKAAARNRIKRLMREAYRLNKHLIGAHTEPGIIPERQFALMFIYTGKEEMPYKYVERKMIKVLEKFAKQV
ncbi:ribonuclease P protein component [Neolewinella aurantiaca]|uniref:Ribonuclease P protein component n=1 Tax=Neolewinella aurantiaca TaxID=2602767 RepID=A0A5C7FGD5_9BACT|nr:ribonuclease P protein component [Neolewinella aurantiaca]TXF88692.1 ribonuclease P protein component [Neolewinella aurantiaca]